MRVQVEVVCSPHPQDEIEAALRAAGERLALTPDSVSVEVHPGKPLVRSKWQLGVEFDRINRINRIYGAVEIL